jgi:hypothetical protein
MSKGRIDKNALTNNVFLAHKAGLAIFVILPIRDMEWALEEHPEWADVRYEQGSVSGERTGKLDIFNPNVIVYLSDFYKNVALYSVDGILLGEDFSYGDSEGAGAIVLEKYKQKYGSELHPGKALARAHDEKEALRTQDYGEGFWNWSNLKKDVLILLLKNIMQSSRTVNNKVRFAIPLHVSGFPQKEELLARFSYDMEAFKKMGVSLYWIAIPHRDIREKQNLSYNKSMEVLSRTVNSAKYMIHDESKMVIAIQTASKSGQILPNSEIEEAVEMVKHAGEPGIAFMVDGDTLITAALTKKTFKRR